MMIVSCALFSALERCLLCDILSVSRAYLTDSSIRTSNDMTETANSKRKSIFVKYFENYAFMSATDDHDKSNKKLPGLLYPRESEAREVKSLDGFWDFVMPPSDDVQKGHRETWYCDGLSKMNNVMQMPVPSSYNDITTSQVVRDHIGPVWYEKSFYVPASWKSERVFLRFGSINYLAQIWLNGDLLTNHEIGHLPIEAEITSCVLFGQKNRVTVAVDNSLLKTCVPQGKIVDMDSDFGTTKVQNYSFDFFNYAGIHRPVLLHTKPHVFIDDITVVTELSDNSGIINYSIEITGTNDPESLECQVNLFDAENQSAINGSYFGIQGTLQVASPKLWWPRGMAEKAGYLYTLEVKVTSKDSEKPDVYRLPIGIRSVEWTSTSFLINKKSVYFRGFGRHEDSAIRGRGLDLVTVARDHELLNWIGANSYRTSHYPYSEEVLDVADKLGFLIIDECPSVDTEKFSSTLLGKHKQSLSELIRRDKNRPSVIMWSVANEPRTAYRDSASYFKQVVQHTKHLDPTRPVTIAIAVSPDDDRVGQYLDVISFNRYNGWYSNPGKLNMITKRIIEEAQAWHDKYKKPVLISEYGADTMPGLHELPEYIWSEEYQIQILSKHFKAFDQLRAKGFFIGEFIWNFADFRTAQTYTRVGGNKKGIFTRDRQPKMAAHHVRKRYHALAGEYDKQKLPDDLENYVISLNSS